MKLNKKILSVLSIGALGMVGLIPVVNAAESTATITFKTPTAAPAILNPDSPDNPIEDGQLDNGKETGEIGVLTLDYVSNFEFGEQELSASTKNYPATNATTPFAQVTDVRGTGAGWRLGASLGTFSNDNGATTSLPGAAIELNSPDVVSTSENTSVENRPLANTVTLSSDEETFNITTAGSTESPESGTGMGTWITRWLANEIDPDNVNGNVVLTVPAAVAEEGTHSATITWTLYNTPDGFDVEPVIPVVPTP